MSGLLWVIVIFALIGAFWYWQFKRKMRSQDSD